MKKIIAMMVTIAAASGFAAHVFPENPNPEDGAFFGQLTRNDWVQTNKTMISVTAVKTNGVSAVVDGIADIVIPEPEVDTNAVIDIVNGQFDGGAQNVNRVIGSFDGISNRIEAIESKEPTWDAKQDAIGDYTTTNAVRDIASSASVTNAGAVAEAKAYTDSYTPGNYAAVSNAAMTAVQPATTLAGYGITDAYTKSEVNAKRLPNPNALSFYSKAGTMIASYDGTVSQSVTVEDADFQAWRTSKNIYLGENSHSTGEDYSVALGVGTEASGTHSVALGAGGVRAAAMHALAVGNSVEARAIASTAIGYSSFANAQSSTAIGGNAYANGERSHAAGWAAIADALNSTAVGNAARVHTGSVGATAIGSGATVGPNATNAVQIGFGTNDDPETLQFMGRKVLLDDLDYAKYEVVTNDYGEEWVYFCGLPGWRLSSPPTWNSSESRWQSLFIKLDDGSYWLTDWSDPDAKGYDATLLTIDGYKSVAYRGIHVVTNLVHSRISTTNDLSHANPVFSNEVLAVSLELFDTNTVAVLNDLAGTVDGIPLEGGAASIGSILLALLAAVAWLKKNKLDNSGGTMTGKLTVSTGNDTTTGFRAHINDNNWIEYKSINIQVRSDTVSGTRIFSFPDNGGVLQTRESDILCTDGIHKVKVDWNSGSPRLVEVQ